MPQIPEDTNADCHLWNGEQVPWSKYMCASLHFESTLSLRPGKTIATRHGEIACADAAVDPTARRWQTHHALPKPYNFTEAQCATPYSEGTLSAASLDVDEVGVGVVFCACFPCSSISAAVCCGDAATGFWKTVWVTTVVCLMCSGIGPEAR